MHSSFSNHTLPLAAAQHCNALACAHSLLCVAQLSQPDPVWCSLLVLLGPGGRLMPGLPSKKLAGFRWKPTDSLGMTGQSSMRGTCVTPKECQMTTSSFLMRRSCSHHAHSSFPLFP